MVQAWRSVSPVTQGDVWFPAQCHKYFLQVNLIYMKVSPPPLLCLYSTPGSHMQALLTPAAGPALQCHEAVHSARLWRVQAVTSMQVCMQDLSVTAGKTLEARMVHIWSLSKLLHVNSSRVMPTVCMAYQWQQSGVLQHNAWQHVPPAPMHSCLAGRCPAFA